MTRAVLTGVWHLSDPKISLASISAMILGAGAAAANGPVAWPWLALVVIGILAVEVAKNASGEVVDFDSGVDQAVRAEERSPFSGGKRVIVDGLLTRRQTMAVAAVAYAIGIGAGVVIAVARESGVWLFGIAGVGLAFFYHANPLRLSYRGFGELAVAVAYGPLIVCGTYLVLRGEVSDLVMRLAVYLGVLIAAFLWINEFPDRRADRGAGKHTLVVRLGVQNAVDVFTVLAVAPFASLLVLSVATGRYEGLPGLLGLPFALRAVDTLRRHPSDMARIVPAQANTLRAFVLFALGTAAGLAWL